MAAAAGLKTQPQTGAPELYGSISKVYHCGSDNRVLTAVFAATGQRIRSLPIKNQRLEQR